MLKIINLKKKKIFSEIKIKNKKNLKFFLKNKGCYEKKIFFIYSKKINRNNIILKIKKKIIMFKVLEFELLNRFYIINNNKKIKIKIKKIKSLCLCKFSFNFF